MATQQYIPPAPKDNNFYGSRNYNRNSQPPANSSRNMNWRNPEKEVTRIPPRFQKQRPAQQSYQASEKASGLPRAQSRSAPEAARRLTIFGTSNVVNNLSTDQLERELNIP